MYRRDPIASIASVLISLRIRSIRSGRLQMRFLGPIADLDVFETRTR
jgi:hypothetical protein